MWNFKLKSSSFAAITAVCGMLLAPSAVMAAPAAGAAVSPGALPAGLFKSQLIEKVQQRRRARARRRATRRARRGARRFRRNARRFRRGRRFRGPYLVVPGVAIPSYYYGTPYYDYDPYAYSGYDYTPAPAPGGSCAHWSRRCTANWGYRNQDYWGCMQYHGCH